MGDSGSGKYHFEFEQELQLDFNLENGSTDYSNFIDYDSSFNPLEDNVSVVTDVSDISSVGHAVETIVYDHYMVEYDVPTPKKKRRKKTLTPITIVAADSIGSCTSRKILRGLLDSGSTRTLLHKDAVPRAARPVEISTKKFNTLAGTMSASKLVHMRDIRLPEFNRSRSIAEQKALIFDGPCNYDIIIGADFLSKAGLTLDYQAKEATWFGDSIPLREPGLKTKDYLAILKESKLQ